MSCGYLKIPFRSILPYLNELLRVFLVGYRPYEIEAAEWTRLNAFIAKLAVAIAANQGCGKDTKVLHYTEKAICANERFEKCLLLPITYVLRRPVGSYLQVSYFIHFLHSTQKDTGVLQLCFGYLGAAESFTSEGLVLTQNAGSFGINA